jgi:hypothetical protein
MAANLLGLPEGRLAKSRPQAALGLYGEGLKWLARFCQRLRPELGGVPAAVHIVKSTEIEPALIRDVRLRVQERVLNVTSAVDRRGFRLLHWPPRRENSNKKPTELSLEHEARLMPGSESALDRLLDVLHRSEGRAVSEYLLPANPRFKHLIVRHYRRELGAQSIDRYYDVPNGLGRLPLIPRMLTVRERLKGGKFMTWGATDQSGKAQDPSMRPLNLELPFLALGSTGVTVRLEFNWIDDLSESIFDAIKQSTSDQGTWQNPLFIASQFYPIEFNDLTPVLEHTTFRQKFAVVDPGREGEAADTIFDVNVDHIVAQDIANGRMGNYADVDIAPTENVDAAVLESVSAFVDSMALRFDLRPAWGTKAWRDANAVGLFSK